MSEVRVGVGVRRRKREEALALVAEYEASGLKRGEFCAGHGLSVATLDLYRKRVRRNAATSKLVAVELHPASRPTAKASSGSFPVAVVLGNGRRIEIGPGWNAAMLAELVCALERA